jgi:hypothetical protein
MKFTHILAIIGIFLCTCVGWFILGDESATGTARRFDSADSAAFGGIVPRLEIEFTPIPTPATGAVLAFAALTRTRRRR